MKRTTGARSVSKCPRRVTKTAYLISHLALPLYAHRSSPKKFTQPQLFACLALKEFSQLDYRKLAALLTDCPELCAAIELHVVPHFTTFQKAAQRLLRMSPAQRLLRRFAWQSSQGASHRPSAWRRATAQAGSRDTSATTTSNDAPVASRYWQKTTYAGFPKAGLLCDCASHVILAVVPGRGPGPVIKHFRAMLDQALRRTRIDAVALDAELVD